MESLAELRRLRETGGRRSDYVCETGERLLEHGGLKRMKSDEVWPVLEQVAFAALDCGKVELAKICVERLDDRFPNSPRVAPLKGMLLEGEGRIDMARRFYENELTRKENNVAIRKRLIALHLHHAESRAVPSPASAGASKATVQTTPLLSVKKGIELLVEHLDTVYTDVEAWQQLADTYAGLGLYEQSLSCLGDLILLQPHHAVWQLRYAETAYTLHDYALAYRSYLRVIELAGPVSAAGMSRRAALGVKLCLAKLNDGGTDSASGTAVPLHAGAIDALLTKELLDAYATEWVGPGSKAAGHDETRALRSWLQAMSAQGAAVEH